MHGNKIQVRIKLSRIIKHRPTIRPQGEYMMNCKCHAPTQ